MKPLSVGLPGRPKSGLGLPQGGGDLLLGEPRPLLMADHRGSCSSGETASSVIRVLECDGPVFRGHVSRDLLRREAKIMPCSEPGARQRSATFTRRTGQSPRRARASLHVWISPARREAVRRSQHQPRRRHREAHLLLDELPPQSQDRPLRPVDLPRFQYEIGTSNFVAFNRSGTEAECWMPTTTLNLAAATDPPTKTMGTTSAPN